MMCYRLKNKDLKEYFEALFLFVGDKIPARLSRNNLFHGHAVFDVVDNEFDFRILFHAYEYPSDYPSSLEYRKSSDAHELDREEQFTSNENDYCKRNAIWSMRHNTLYIPDFSKYLRGQNRKKISDMPYGSLFDTSVQGWEKACKVEEDRIGELIITFNYFPNEKVSFFLKR